MTRRQAETFVFVKTYIDSHGYPPTYVEIAKGIGVSSLSVVHKHLHCLKAEGIITLVANTQQSIKIVSHPADSGRFELEGPHHLWDKELKCYWMKAKEISK